MILSEETKVCIDQSGKNCPSCNLAEKEIGKYLNLCLGIDVETIEKPDKGFDVVISLEPDRTDMGKQEFSIEITKEKIRISGKNGVGVLYGVYTFIERFLGVRFLAPEKEWVPENKKLIITETDITEGPALKKRGGTPIFVGHKVSVGEFHGFIDWMGKNRLNYLAFGYIEDSKLLKECYSEIDARGIKLDIGGHCLDKFLYGVWDIDTSKGWEEIDGIIEEKFNHHPEWHCLKDGFRVVCKGMHAHFCLRCDEAIDEFCGNAIKYLDEYADILDSFSICLNDSLAVFCECDKCAAKSREENIQYFYNRAAAEIHKKYPELTIRYSVYSDYILPAEKLPLGKNIGIDIALWGPDYSRGLGDIGAKDKMYIDIINKWRKLCSVSAGNNDVGICQYYSYTPYSFGPRLKTMFRDAVMYKEMGISGCHDNLMELTVLKDGFPGSLTSYFMARAFWTPEIGPETAMSDLFEPIFGKISGTMKECMRICDNLDAHSVREPVWWRWRQYPIDLLKDSLDCSRHTLEKLSQLEKLLNMALAGSETEYASNLIKSWLVWQSTSVDRVVDVNSQFEILEMLIKTLDSGKDLHDSSLIDTATGKFKEISRIEGEIKDIDAVSNIDAAKLTDFFGLPAKLAVYTAFLGKGKERALANLNYNAIYNWSGCKGYHPVTGTENCPAIGCSAKIYGPAMKAYPVREPANVADTDTIQESRWIKSATG